MIIIIKGKKLALNALDTRFPDVTAILSLD